MSDMLNIAVTDTFLHRLYETDKYIHEARGSVGNFSLSVYDKLQFTLIQISTRIASFWEKRNLCYNNMALVYNTAHGWLGKELNVKNGKGDLLIIWEN